MGGVGCTCNGAQVEDGAEVVSNYGDCGEQVSRSKCRVFPHSLLDEHTPSTVASSSEASPSAPPKANRSARELESDGECMLYLETVVNVPYLQNAFCSRPGGNGVPSVRAWAENESGEMVGKVAAWPARHCNSAPSWCTAYSLGFPLSRAVATGVARLKLELWDNAVVLGSLSIPYDELPVHRTIEKDLDLRPEAGPLPSGKACTVSFQVIDSGEVRAPKTIFLVRHGESSWNKAQSKLDLYEMGRQTDHPLSPDGRDQAEALNELIGKECKDSRLMNPDVVYVSPLTRAIQTAVIGLGKVLSEPGSGHLVLMANAREKQNFGGFDSQPMAIGSAVIKRTLDELVLLYQGRKTGEGIVNAFRKLKFDTQEVQGRWWNPVAAESDAEVKIRLEEFMAQLKYTPHKTIVVVGHSHFFRAVFKEFLNPNFKDKHKDFAHQLCTSKLANCGVARLDLDPSITSGGPITNVELVLGTKLVHDGGLCKCSGPPAKQQEEYELRP